MHRLGISTGLTEIQDFADNGRFDTPFSTYAGNAVQGAILGATGAASASMSILPKLAFNAIGGTASSVIGQNISAGHVNWQEAGISGAINAATYGIFDAASVIGSTFKNGFNAVKNGVENYFGGETGTLKLANLGLKEAEQTAQTIDDVTKLGKYDVGIYNEIKGAPGLDAHHVGQKALMKDFIPGYDPDFAPSILVPKVGHTIRGLNGIVSRSTNGITNARDLIARDIMELRRVYPDIPNIQLQQLINLNKELYPTIK